VRLFCLKSKEEKKKLVHVSCSKQFKILHSNPYMHSFLFNQKALKTGLCDLLSAVQKLIQDDQDKNKRRLKKSFPPSIPKP
jgi:hypothetical protein